MLSELLQDTNKKMRKSKNLIDIISNNRYNKTK